MFTGWTKVQRFHQICVSKVAATNNKHPDSLTQTTDQNYQTYHRRCLLQLLRRYLRQQNKFVAEEARQIYKLSKKRKKHGRSTEQSTQIWCRARHQTKNVVLMLPNKWYWPEKKFFAKSQFTQYMVQPKISRKNNFRAERWRTKQTGVFCCKQVQTNKQIFTFRIFSLRQGRLDAEIVKLLFILANITLHNF